MVHGIQRRARNGSFRCTAELTQKCWFFLSLLMCISLCWGHPFHMTVPKHTTECLYDYLEEGESLTLSTYVFMGDAELQIKMMVEGPVSHEDITKTDSKAFFDSIDRYNKGYYRHPAHHQTQHAVADFEHMNLMNQDENPDWDDDDDSHIIWDDDDSATPEQRRRRDEERKYRREMAEKRRKENEKKRKQIMERTANHIRDEGEPEERTIKAATAGWYRGCVVGRWYEISVEVELRKSTDYGGINGETGHVYHWHDYQMAMEDADWLEGDTAKEEGISEEDFETAKRKLQNLRNLVNEIQVLQARQRYMANTHRALNSFSHDRMKYTSAVQTGIFIVLTLIQMYLVRSWFRGPSSLLG